MTGFLREHSVPVVVSVLLHGLLAAGLVLFSVMSGRRSPPSLQPLPIDAVVVDSQVLHAVQRAQAERAEQEIARAQAVAAAAAAAKAAAIAADAAQAEQAARDARVVQDAEVARAAEVARGAEVARAAEAEQAQRRAAADAANSAAAEQQHASEVKKALASKQAAGATHAAEAKQALQAKQALEAKQAAEAKLAAEAKQAAAAKQAADAKHALDEHAKQERETELRRALADEEHMSAVESGPLRDRYVTSLRNKIQGAWIKPPSARAGVDCLVEVTQIPGGEVTAARVTQCNGDDAVRQSIENAVYRASPLPDPPDPALFERHFVFRFRPND